MTIVMLIAYMHNLWSDHHFAQITPPSWKNVVSDSKRMLLKMLLRDAKFYL